MSTASAATARERMALALDVSDLDSALSLATGLGEYFGIAKVGLELFVSEGPRCVSMLSEAGFSVFLDLKLHDIPNTVARAAAAAAASGATWVTIHAAGGPDMIKAGVEGFGEPDLPGGQLPLRAGVLGVTVLTSSPTKDADQVTQRARMAHGGGCAGVVCAGSEVEALRKEMPDLACVVPGIRMPGDGPGDQARITTPKAALLAGAAMLVIGRAVTAADSPAEAAAGIQMDVLAALGAQIPPK